MARRLTAFDICGEAVRRVERYGASQVEPEPEQLEIALIALQMEVDALKGGVRMHAFTESNIVLTLQVTTPVTVSYAFPLGPIVPGQDSITADLTSITADGKASFADTGNSALVPSDGIERPIFATKKLDGVQRGEPLTFLTRREYERILTKDLTGEPHSLYFDYLSSGVPVLYVYPVPNVAGWTLDLTFETFAPTIVGEPDQVLPLRVAWAKWLMYTLCVNLGLGGLSFRTPSEIKLWEDQVDKAWEMLQTYELREYKKLKDRVVAYRANP